MDNLVQDASMEELKNSYENADVIKSSDVSDDLARAEIPENLRRALPGIDELRQFLQ